MVAWPKLGSERGAVVVSDALVTVLVVVLVAASLQLAGALYVRNTVTDATAAAARAQALVYAPPGAGEQRLRELMASAVPGVRLNRVSVSRIPAPVAGRTFVVVDAWAALPLFGPWGLTETLHVRGHALAEETTP